MVGHVRNCGGRCHEQNKKRLDFLEHLDLEQVKIQVCGKGDSRELWLTCYYSPVVTWPPGITAVACHEVCMGCSLCCQRCLMCENVTTQLTEAERLPFVLEVVLKEKW